MPAPVRATSPDELLEMVERARAERGLSKAELARRSRVRAETVRDLLTRRDANPTVRNVLQMLQPLGLGLGLVELPGAAGPTVDELGSEASEAVRLGLSRLGAPIFGRVTGTANTTAGPEEVLVGALALSRVDASIARALPVAIWKTRRSVDRGRIRREATRRGLIRVWGFFLELTASLGGDPALAREARSLHGRLPRRPTPFFNGAEKSPYETKLAELRTPDVARRWGFRMNMTLDSFRSTFAKAVR